MAIDIESLESRIKELEKITNINPQVYFTYTDDEYGEMAKKLHDEKGPLRYAYPGDAGFDLPIILSKEDLAHGHKIIWPGERELLHTGIRIELPSNCFARIVHRSSTEKRHRLRVVEGTIDAGYRGPVLIQIHNTNECKLEVHHGNKYAQMILCDIRQATISYRKELSTSTRGTNGFGSSDTHRYKAVK